MTPKTEAHLKTIDTEIDGQQNYIDSVFPFVYECQAAGSVDDVTAWIASRRDKLLTQSTTHGAVLLRGFPVRSADDFDAEIQALDVTSFEYRKSLSNQAVEIADELAFDVQWQAGDVVLIDNTVAMHARRPFVGTRKVLASLAEMRTQSFQSNSRIA